LSIIAEPSFPAVAAGFAVAKGGLVTTSYEYGLAVIVLAGQGWRSHVEAPAR
jgi:hypothetical protein